MVALHVVGNGFDLQHDLPTRYDPDFKQLALRRERFAGEWECYSEVGDLWADLEENLAYPDTGMLLEHLEFYAPDLLSDRESDRDGIIHEAEQLLDFPLDEFAEQADKALEDKQPLRLFEELFEPSDYFLSFNYTHTLEYLYAIDSDRIAHVHGEVGGEPLIMGYAPGAIGPLSELRQWDYEEQSDYYRSTAHGALRRHLETFEKSYQLGKLGAFTHQISERIDRVVVYGMSFGKVDKPYFDQLAETFPGVPWIIYAYCEEALSDACTRFDEYECGVSYQARVLHGPVPTLNS